VFCCDLLLQSALRSTKSSTAAGCVLIVRKVRHAEKLTKYERAQAVAKRCSCDVSVSKRAPHSDSTSERPSSISEDPRVSNGTDKPPRHPATCNWSRTPILGQSFCYLFPMLMTEEIVEAFLKCETKSHQYFQRAVGVQSEFSEWQRNRRHDSTDWFQRQQRVLCRCELDPVEGRRTIYPHSLRMQVYPPRSRILPG
jgi:hypothetical protein